MKKYFFVWGPVLIVPLILVLFGILSRVICASPSNVPLCDAHQVGVYDNWFFYIRPLEGSWIISTNAWTWFPLALLIGALISAIAIIVDTIFNYFLLKKFERPLRFAFISALWAIGYLYVAYFLINILSIILTVASVDIGVGLPILIFLLPGVFVLLKKLFVRHTIDPAQHHRMLVLLVVGVAIALGASVIPGLYLAVSTL